MTSTPTPTQAIATATPAGGPSLPSRAVIAASGNLRLAAEALNTTDAELLSDILSDPHFPAAAESSLALSKLRLVSELTEHVIAHVDEMSPTEAGRLITRLIETSAKAAALRSTSSSTSQPTVAIQNNTFSGADPSQSAQEATRERLAERLAAAAIPTTAS